MHFSKYKFFIFDLIFLLDLKRKNNFEEFETI